ncbi:hypothetical protein LRP52_29275 [Photobacterium sp. ZSDE20]|uniref:Uncharacterized protein n=1 Tax=Photobacterium pectinilyticum TaxID=2906793 RepID=A0ABT1N6C1_9GAMM|nr:hypothetical protein [Photobacterium sp. ZSDE20]MCQ1060285.1 hypothetical protein [Photobacterium sp. ZSDE20]MDD1826272.1 hypothetical protein [Photobacterium sp. ZSDE20]
MITFNRVIALPDQDSGLSKGYVRLANCHIGTCVDDKSKFIRRIPVKIANQDNQSWIVAYPLGSNGLKGLNKTSLALDYDFRLLLGVNKSKTTNLLATKATYFEQLAWYCSHPDNATKTSMRLGVIGCLLGMVSLIISIF